LRLVLVALLLVTAPATSSIARASSGGDTADEPLTTSTGPMVLATIGIADNPVRVAVNPTTNRLYVTHSNTGLASVLDGISDAVIASLPVGKDPFGVAVNPTTNRVYVGDEGVLTLSVIDGASNTVVTLVPDSNDAWDLAVNHRTNRAYVAGFAAISVIDLATNEVVAAIPFPQIPLYTSVPSAVAVNPATNRIYAVNGANAGVMVIDGQSNAVVGSVLVGNPGAGSVAVAVNPATNRIYASTLASDRAVLKVIDGATNSIVATVALPGHVDVVDGWVDRDGRGLGVAGGVRRPAHRCRHDHEYHRGQPAPQWPPIRPRGESGDEPGLRGERVR
jgi:YVTN family beta-propeller protein